MCCSDSTSIYIISLPALGQSKDCTRSNHTFEYLPLDPLYIITFYFGLLNGAQARSCKYLLKVHILFIGFLHHFTISCIDVIQR